MSKYAVNDLVKLHPCTDWWMRGATHGRVVKAGRKLLAVELLRGFMSVTPRRVVKLRADSKNICKLGEDWE